jgi:amino acid permease
MQGEKNKMPKKKRKKKSNKVIIIIGFIVLAVIIGLIYNYGIRESDRKSMWFLFFRKKKICNNGFKV